MRGASRLPRRHACPTRPRGKPSRQRPLPGNGPAAAARLEHASGSGLVGPQRELFAGPLLCQGVEPGLQLFLAPGILEQLLQRLPAVQGFAGTRQAPGSWTGSAPSRHPACMQRAGGHAWPQICVGPRARPPRAPVAEQVCIQEMAKGQVAHGGGQGFPQHILQPLPVPAMTSRDRGDEQGAGGMSRAGGADPKLEGPLAAPTATVSVITRSSRRLQGTICNRRQTLKPCPPGPDAADGERLHERQRLAQLRQQLAAGRDWAEPVDRLGV